MLKALTPEKALIFRIVHRDNLPWILGDGLHCQSSGTSYQPDEVLTDGSGCCAALPARCAAAFPSVSTS
jgi:hypothetical protein